MESKPTPTVNTSTALESRARDAIISHRRLYNQIDRLHFSESDGTLVIRGRLPTFYLKQLLQSALMELGAIVIDNRVEVVGLLK